MAIAIRQPRHLPRKLKDTERRLEKIRFEIARLDSTPASLQQQEDYRQLFLSNHQNTMRDLELRRKRLLESIDSQSEGYNGFDRITGAPVARPVIVPDEHASTIIFADVDDTIKAGYADPIATVLAKNSYYSTGKDFSTYIFPGVASYLIELSRGPSETSTPLPIVLLSARPISMLYKEPVFKFNKILKAQANSHNSLFPGDPLRFRWGDGVGNGVHGILHGALVDLPMSLWKSWSGSLGDRKFQNLKAWAAEKAENWWSKKNCDCIKSSHNR